MLTLEQFKASIEAIQRQETKELAVADALYSILDGRFVPVFADEVVLQLVALLEKCMQDKGEVISWWIWEDTDKRVWDKDGNVIANLDTIEALYNYLKEGLKND